MMNVTGVILSGGKSIRMGEDKAWVDYQGKPMISYAMEALKNVVDKIVISANDERYKELGVQIVEDKVEDLGPLGGLVSVIETVASDNYLVLTCDMPEIRAKHLEDILENANGSADAVCYKVEEFYYPFPAVYSASVLGKMKDQLDEGELRMMRFLDRIEVKYIDLSNMDKSIVKNVNSKE